MKKIISLLLLIFLSISLFACGGSPANIYDEEVGGEVYTVDTDEKTITYDGYVFNYYINENSVTVTYPDSSRFVYDINKDTYTHNEEYMSTTLSDSETLIKALRPHLPKAEKAPNYFIALLFAAPGIIILSKEY